MCWVTSLSGTNAVDLTASALSYTIETQIIELPGFELIADESPITVLAYPGIFSQLHSLQLSSMYFVFDLMYVLNDRMIFTISRTLIFLNAGFHSLLRRI